MAADLPRIVKEVREDLMKEYKKDPSAVWQKPFIVVAEVGGGVKHIDGSYPPDHIIGWLATWKHKKIEAVAVGRMVVKRGATIDPTTQEPIIVEKAILVSARSFVNGRTIVSITPTKEHRDYRSIDKIEKGSAIFRPGLESPDVTKKIIDPANGEAYGYMQGAFMKEQRMDSLQGHRCVMDPLIEGAVGLEHKE